MRHIKGISLLLAALCLSACAAKSGFEPYQAQKEHTKVQGAKYQLAEILFSLDGPTTNSAYPSEDTLSSQFLNYASDALAERGLAGDGYTLNISVEWQRHMTRNKFSHASCQFRAELKREEEIVALDHGDPLNADSIKSNHLNAFNNLTRLGEKLTLSGDEDSEQRELKRCAHMIVDRLPE